MGPDTTRLTVIDEFLYKLELLNSVVDGVEDALIKKTTITDIEQVSIIYKAIPALWKQEYDNFVQNKAKTAKNLDDLQKILQYNHKIFELKKSYQNMSIFNQNSDITNAITDIGSLHPNTSKPTPQFTSEKTSQTIKSENSKCCTPIIEL